MGERLQNPEGQVNWNWLSKYRNPLYGLFILWVFMFHVWEAFPKLTISDYVFENIISRGNLGVDAFLFLSGISMYYAMKKRREIGKNFYSGRFTKIIKVYLFFCIPYFILMLLLGKSSLTTTIQQITFTRARVSSFWFLLCIAICYAIYPAIYRLIESGNKKSCVGIVIFYIVLLVILNTFFPEAYEYDEIMLSRFPVFVIGCLAGPCVYEKRPIPAWLLALILIPIIGRDIPTILTQWFAPLQQNKVLIMRLFGGMQAVGGTFLMLIVLRCFEGARVFKWLSSLGGITLEFYVVHLAIINLTKNVLKYAPKGRVELLAFTVIYFVVSLLISLALHKIVGLHLKRKKA